MKNKLFVLIFTLSSITVLSGCGSANVSPNTNQPNRDIDTVFGGITVGKNSTVGDVSSVNGGISISAGVKAKDVDTVNGGINVSDNSQLDSLETVNGGISIGKNVSVKYSVEVVNGEIKAGSESRIGRTVETVNGDIRLKGVSVGKNIETVNGDIVLADMSVVEGDIIVQKSDSWFFDADEVENQILSVDSNSEIKGTIHLYKPITLKIDQQAKVGEVKKHYKTE